jgi:hypothetical protein
MKKIKNERIISRNLEGKENREGNKIKKRKSKQEEMEIFNL